MQPNFEDSIYPEKMQKENFLKTFLACLLTVSISATAISQEHEQHANTEEHAEEEAGAVNTKEEVKDFIDHHLKDSHYFNFYANGETGEHVGFPLPVIIWDDGLKVFSASKFHHGEDVVEIDGTHYKLYHTKIYKTDAEGTIVYGEDGFPAMRGHWIFLSPKM